MTACAKCGVEDRQLQTWGGNAPSCTNKEACDLRVELRDLRAALTKVAGLLHVAGDGLQAAAEKRKGV